jgi:hypothetical protein
VAQSLPAAPRATVEPWIHPLLVCARSDSFGSMALGTCRECGWSVAKSAPTCPRCGAKQAAKTSLVAWLALGALLLFGMRLCRAAVSEHAPAAQAATTAQGVAQAAMPVASATPLPRLTAAKLRADYKANQVAADAKYQGKRYDLKATVVAVRSALGDEPQVWLESELDPVIAEGLTKHFAATLNKGDSITAKCTVKGVFVDMPTLDCGGPQ